MPQHNTRREDTTNYKTPAKAHHQLTSLNGFQTAMEKARKACELQ